LRSPKASEGQGGALGEAEARKRGNTVGVRDQIMDLVASQGAKVSRASVNLPTPTASDIYTGNFSSKQHSEGSLHSVRLAQIVNRPDLLPTPNTMEHREIKTPEQIAELKAKSPGGYRNLRETVINEMTMLPTPTTQDGKNNGGPSKFNRNTKPLNTQVLVKTEWGKFESAVRLWEQEIERQAPSPTKPDGKEGAHRLSSKFTEWMMGLPEGWITDVGLTRNEELKLAGNGVVPQQAELALRLLLNSDEE
jgi:DNA (cytosine-5)-methyltransferase 1